MNSDPRSPLCYTLWQSDAASAACVPLQTRSQCRRKRGRKLCKLLRADYFDQLLFFLLNQRSALGSQSRLYMSVAYSEPEPQHLGSFLQQGHFLQWGKMRNAEDISCSKEGTREWEFLLLFCVAAPSQVACWLFRAIPRESGWSPR